MLLFPDGKQMTMCKLKLLPIVVVDTAKPRDVPKVSIILFVVFPIDEAIRSNTRHRCHN